MYVKVTNYFKGENILVFRGFINFLSHIAFVNTCK